MPGSVVGNQLFPWLLCQASPLGGVCLTRTSSKAVTQPEAKIHKAQTPKFHLPQSLNVIVRKMISMGWCRFSPSVQLCMLTKGNGAICLCSNCSGCKAAHHETPTLLNGRQIAADVAMAEGATEVL